MPGITGFITENPDRQCASARLHRMLGQMVHDESYSVGTHIVPELGCYLGWTSHAGASSDCNPIVSDDEDAVIIFVGEHLDHGCSDTGTAAHTSRSLLALYKRF